MSNIQSNYPLIVIVHGNGQDYLSYDNFLKHLAHNGFIAASISCMIQNIIPLIFSSGTSQYFFNLGRTRYKYEHSTTQFYKWITSTTSWALISFPSSDYVLNLSSTAPTIEFINKPSHGMGGLGRANTLFHHLKKIKDLFGTGVQNNIGLIGHSRGGEAILTAKRSIHLQDGTWFTFKAKFNRIQ